MATGGKRPGSGRKPQPLAGWRLNGFDWKAYYALQLFVAVMEDDEQPLALRLQCAEVIIKTVWGGTSAREIARQDAATEIL